MNIFEVFCHGDGRMDEPNMSSVLAFLFNADRPHGYSRAFLGEFLEPFRADIECLDFWRDIRPRNRPQTMVEAINAFGRISVSLEEPLPVPLDVAAADIGARQSRRDLDIIVRMYSRDDRLRFVVAIENKIRDGAAADLAQLSDEYALLRHSVSDEVQGVPQQGPAVPIIFVYLTPKPLARSGSGVQALWAELRLPERCENAASDIKKNYVWGASELAHIPSISGLAHKMLENEHWGRINPASSHSALLLRSLIKFIDNDFGISSAEFGPDAGNAMVEVDIQSFWDSWPGSKLGTLPLAQSVFAIVQGALQQSMQRIDGSGCSIGIRSTKTRITVHLPSGNAAAVTSVRMLENPIVRIRNDGRTSGSMLHLEFERRAGTAPETLFAGLPQGLRDRLQIAVSDRRTAYDLFIPRDLPDESLTSALQLAVNEAVVSVIG